MTDIAARIWESKLTEEQRQRLLGYKKRWDYYNGNQQNMLPVRPGQPNDNVQINLCRLVVDKGASFLFSGIDFELQEGETTPAEEALREFWRRNRMDTFLFGLAVSGGVCGHVFVKIVPGQEKEDVRLVNVPAEYVEVYYDDQDIADVYRYRIVWEAKDRNGRQIFRKQDIERDDNGRWRVVNRLARGRANWEADPDNPDVDWPWPWPPMIDCQNMLCPGSYFGLSDIEDDMMKLQDAINYIASKIQRILRYHMHPKTYGWGFGRKDIQIGEDDMLILPSADAGIKNLEMQSDLGSGIAFMDRMINWLLAIARIPRIDPAVINVGALSGFALRILYGDLIEKTAVKRGLYGDMLIELNRRVLEMLGFGDDNIVTIYWGEAVPADPNADVMRDKFELDYGLASKQTVRARRGLDNEAEEERMKAQQVAEGNIGALLVEQWQKGQKTGFEGGGE